MPGFEENDKFTTFIDTNEAIVALANKCTVTIYNKYMYMYLHVCSLQLWLNLHELLIQVYSLQAV